MPDTITLLHVPPESPELNPVENVRQDLRRNTLANRVFEDDRRIVSACCDAWNFLVTGKRTLAPITARTWSTVNR